MNMEVPKTAMIENAGNRKFQILQSDEEPAHVYKYFHLTPDSAS